eukprot:GDKK01070181.1.p1 GENE.GDKK01070181.1~~GDKK01070181.1.p1  ORF type:complete len:1271 (-),score=325.25 GDKK01070181.1:111-3923(-)
MTDNMDEQSPVLSNRNNNTFFSPEVNKGDFDDEDDDDHHQEFHNIKETKADLRFSKGRRVLSDDPTSHAMPSGFFNEDDDENDDFEVDNLTSENIILMKKDKNERESPIRPSTVAAERNANKDFEHVYYNARHSSEEVEVDQSREDDRQKAHLLSQPSKKAPHGVQMDENDNDLITPKNKMNVIRNHLHHSVDVSRETLSSVDEPFWNIDNPHFNVRMPFEQIENSSTSGNRELPAQCRDAIFLRSAKGVSRSAGYGDQNNSNLNINLPPIASLKSDLLVSPSLKAIVSESTGWLCDVTQQAFFTPTLQYRSAISGAACALREMVKMKAFQSENNAGGNLTCLSNGCCVNHDFIHCLPGLMRVDPDFPSASLLSSIDLADQEGQSFAKRLNPTIPWSKIKRFLEQDDCRKFLGWDLRRLLISKVPKHPRTLFSEPTSKGRSDDQANAFPASSSNAFCASNGSLLTQLCSCCGGLVFGFTKRQKWIRFKPLIMVLKDEDLLKVDSDQQQAINVKKPSPANKESKFSIKHNLDSLMMNLSSNKSPEVFHRTTLFNNELPSSSTSSERVFGDCLLASNLPSGFIFPSLDAKINFNKIDKKSMSSNTKSAKNQSSVRHTLTIDDVSFQTCSCSAVFAAEEAQTTSKDTREAPTASSSFLPFNENENIDTHQLNVSRSVGAVHPASLLHPANKLSTPNNKKAKEGATEAGDTWRTVNVDETFYKPWSVNDKKFLESSMITVIIPMIIRKALSSVSTLDNSQLVSPSTLGKKQKEHETSPQSAQSTSPINDNKAFEYEWISRDVVTERIVKISSALSRLERDESNSESERDLISSCKHFLCVLRKMQALLTNVFVLRGASQFEGRQGVNPQKDADWLVKFLSSQQQKQQSSILSSSRNSQVDAFTLLNIMSVKADSIKAISNNDPDEFDYDFVVADPARSEMLSEKTSDLLPSEGDLLMNENHVVDWIKNYHWQGMILQNHARHVKRASVTTSSARFYSLGDSFLALLPTEQPSPTSSLPNTQLSPSNKTPLSSITKRNVNPTLTVYDLVDLWRHGISPKFHVIETNVLAEMIFAFKVKYSVLSLRQAVSQIAPHSLRSSSSPSANAKGLNTSPAKFLLLEAQESAVTGSKMNKPSSFAAFDYGETRIESLPPPKLSRIDPNLYSTGKDSKVNNSVEPPVIWIPASTSQNPFANRDRLHSKNYASSSSNKNSHNRKSNERHSSSPGGRQAYRHSLNDFAENSAAKNRDWFSQEEQAPNPNAAISNSLSSKRLNRLR